MPRGNVNNLKTPTTEEARSRGRMGGIASGRARKEKKEIQNALQRRLAGVYEIGKDGSPLKLDGYEAIAEAMIIQAVNGNVKAATFIRDTIGEKPIDEIRATMGNENLLAMQEYLEKVKNGKLKKS